MGKGGWLQSPGWHRTALDCRNGLALTSAVATATAARWFLLPICLDERFVRGLMLVCRSSM